ncbi:MAG: hypothetical protein PWP18_1229, partial [Thermoanaerobacter sp.]|nr:hypothetical protein [Thermoanaerobacter sp.]
TLRSGSTWIWWNWAKELEKKEKGNS